MIKDYFKMKNTILNIGAFLILLCVIPNVSAQINRTLETKVADVLAQMPTKNQNHCNKLMQEIIDLKSEGILQFCDMLIPAGTGNDYQVRFALNSLAIYAGGLEKNIKENLVEKSLLLALQKETDIEIKFFLIERLALCGSNASIKELSTYLSNDKLYNVALGSLTSIGTTQAAQVIFEAAKGANDKIKPSLINALGDLHYTQSIDFLQKLTNSNKVSIKENALMALAEIGEVKANNTLINAAKDSKFKLDESKSIIALIHYASRLQENDEKNLSNEIGKILLKNCIHEDQLHFRSAGIKILRENDAKGFLKIFLKELKNKNKNYRGAILNISAKGLTKFEVEKLVKLYRKLPSETKMQLLSFLQDRKETVVFDKCIFPALNDKNEKLREAAIKTLAHQPKEKSLPILLNFLKESIITNKYKVIEETLLRTCHQDDGETLVGFFNNSTIEGKKVLVKVLAAKRAKNQFKNVHELFALNNKDLNTILFEALPNISTSENLSELIDLIEVTNNGKDIKNIQKAIISIINTSKQDYSKVIFEAYNSIKNNATLLPVLPVLNNKEALQLVTKSLKSGNKIEKNEALNALASWRNNDALPVLFNAVNDPNLRSKAFVNYLAQVGKSSYPADQKLLLLKKLMTRAKTNEEKGKIIKKVGSVKTFLALVFVYDYFKDAMLKSVASNAAVKIVLPTPGNKDGLEGTVVRNIIGESIDNLTGPDSQYIKIDVKEFLSNMSNEKGFVSIFNGKDLTGWEGLVENPIARSKMSKRTLAKKQRLANQQMNKDWFVKDGVIGFKGEGYNNICTIKDYADFEMIVDWKITNGGDSGIYLRGTPQVQIWDIARTNVGAQVGSGGLYNNQKNERIPLVVADNPVNEWNTFRIKMIGERVTVYLNGVLVTNNIALENYWDRKLPIFVKEAIELQAHGEDLGFRNVYIREINSRDDLLSNEERKAGFKSLFNGRDLDHWIGNKTDYIVENNEIAVRPKQGGHGNLYTAEEYSDFNFRFEFKLTPGANNGLGIHTPLKGDAAYVGKELQILDNTAAIYANLKPYQYHGSVYGVIPAKRGHLNPVGQWNSEEVIVKGDAIKIILNGTVIVDGNLKEASKNGTLDGKEHSGLNRNNGHIGFLGHGSELQFRNIRIKKLSK